MGDWTDPFFRLRYGVTDAEKQGMVYAGQIPGRKPTQNAQDMAREERRAAGYLFAQQHPNLAPAVQPTVDYIRSFFDAPEVVSAASEGMDQALAQAIQRQRQLAAITAGGRQASLADLVGWR
jgi:hypothetical protein